MGRVSKLTLPNFDGVTDGYSVRTRVRADFLLERGCELQAHVVPHVGEAARHAVQAAAMRRNYPRGPEHSQHVARQ